MKSLSRKYIWLRFIPRVVVMGIACSSWTVLMLLTASAVEDDAMQAQADLSVLLIPLAFVVYAALLYVWLLLDWHFYRFTISEDTFNKEYGVIWKRYVSIPYLRIQNVDIRRSLLERLFGLSTIHIQTAGAATGFIPEGVLPGLPKEEAFRLREEILKKVHSHEVGRVSTLGV